MEQKAGANAGRPVGPRRPEDLDPAGRRMYEEVVAGLGASPRSLPPKYFYDETGSELFEEITRLDEYYLTRTETSIMEARGADMARAIGPRALLVEFGSGSSAKTEILLDRLEDPAGYVPIDISGDYLREVAEKLRARHPGLPIEPLEADFTRPLRIPEAPRAARRRIVYFPGSTIGNFSRLEAVRLLGRMRRLAGPSGGVLIGYDRLKQVDRLRAAYNDARGVTARFNLNLLTHLNRVLGADFDLEGFEHDAPFDEDASRIEMRLVSRRSQTVRIVDRRFDFDPGDYVVTEHAHKYAPEVFSEIASAAGLRAVQEWSDRERLFSVQLLEVVSG